MLPLLPRLRLLRPPWAPGSCRRLLLLVVLLQLGTLCLQPAGLLTAAAAAVARMQP
jgi:hypothetical protein